MRKNKFVIPVLLSALAIAIVGGVFTFRAVSAAVPSSSVASKIFPHRGGPPGLGGDFQGVGSDQYLADALGITAEELDTALGEANTAALAQAVDQGLITQAQADQLTSKGQVLRFNGRGGGWLSESGIDFNALLAKSLDISLEKLESAYAQAFTARINQAVTDGNLTQEQADLMQGRYALGNSSNFQTAMQTAYETAVQQSLKDGVITQAQADQLLQNVPMMGFGGKHGFGGFGEFGHGRHGGEWEGFPVSPVDPGTTP
jgi:hypothetical protein